MTPCIVADLARHTTAGSRRDAMRLARIATRSLYDELALHPKPGLVSLRSRGAHRDMDATTFMRSLFALRGYLRDVALAGACGAPFEEQRALAVQAEHAMLAATGGVNTHRGAIFSLGMLTATAAAMLAAGESRDDKTWRTAIVGRYSEPLARLREDNGESHGAAVERSLGVRGACGEAQAGFPNVFERALPALRRALAAGASSDLARLDALFALLASVDDTNVLYRGGPAALGWLQREARAFNASGGALAHDALRRAEALDRAMTQRNLSPGGCADLLACTLFVHAVQVSMQ
ncbi:MAG TPA: triphosphoribosyl-dephospho-CoA synthase MdcB [Casimicrobiaceae bacterium]|nr:triphosphoribosyl-dephospho-CoA synthase MdcB [Casimicrobiaceae bacterium]